MDAGNALRITPRLIVGLGILAFGLLWTMDNLDVLEASRIMEWWPAIIVAAGLARLTQPRANRLGSVLLIVFGSLLLLDNLDVIDIDAGDIIPLAIAALGAKIVWDALNRRGRTAPAGDDSSVVDAFAMMAAVKRKSTATEFRGGELSAIMGGMEIDLTQARMPEGGEAVIDTFALWGGIEIRVPAGWQVRGSVLPLMGGFEDKTQPGSQGGPVLHVRGAAIMAGVEVKN